MLITATGARHNCAASRAMSFSAGSAASELSGDDSHALSSGCERSSAGVPGLLGERVKTGVIWLCCCYDPRENLAAYFNFRCNYCFGTATSSVQVQSAGSSLL